MIEIAIIITAFAVALLLAAVGFVVGRELGDTRGVLGWTVGCLLVIAGFFYAGGIG